MLCLSITQNSLAAVGAACQWDVATTGDDNNGGGFVHSPYTAAPAAPTCTLQTGGTISPGTYYCVITYTDAYGASVASPETSFTVTNSTNDSVLVTSPAASGLCRTYQVYMGTVSGGPYWYVASTNIGTDTTRNATPPTSGAQPCGIDYSQQDSAQLTGTDLACADHTTPYWSITSATGGFTPAMVGNLVQITTTGAGAHFVVGFYQITQFISTNEISVDRDPTDGTNETAGTFYVGGRLATIDKAVDQAVALDGNRFHVKSGTYNEMPTPGDSGGSYGHQRIYLLGYKTSHYDTCNDNDRPLIDGQSTRDHCLAMNTRQNWVVANFRFSGATDNNVDSESGGVNEYINCKSTNAGAGGWGFTSPGSGNRNYWVNCESASNSGKGHDNDAGGSYALLYRCNFHDNAEYAIISASPTIIFQSIFDSNGGDGAFIYNPVILDSVFYGNTGDGIGFTGNSGTPNIFMNNIIMNNGGYGINRDNGCNSWFGGVPLTQNNIFYNNTAGAGYNIILDNTQLTNNPLFTNATAGDFTFTSNSPALAAGYPQTPNGLTGDYQFNIGIDQDDNAAGGGGVSDIFGWIE